MVNIVNEKLFLPVIITIVFTHDIACTRDRKETRSFPSTLTMSSTWTADDFVLFNVYEIRSCGSLYCIPMSIVFSACEVNAFVMRALPRTQTFPWNRVLSNQLRASWLKAVLTMHKWKCIATFMFEKRFMYTRIAVFNLSRVLAEIVLITDEHKTAFGVGVYSKTQGNWDIYYKRYSKNVCNFKNNRPQP